MYDIANARKEDMMPRQPSPVFINGRSRPLPGMEDAIGLKRHRIVFGWYGGKFNHLRWLLPLLPDCHHYCEPFAGSAAVLLNRPPSLVETYNDIDGAVVNFFRVLRDQKDALIEAIALTPFSREEFFRALNSNGQAMADVERARRFFVRARQVRTGLAQTASLGRWANCKNTTRSGMSGVVSRWLGSVETLPEIAERLLRVQIENRPGGHRDSVKRKNRRTVQ
jgi:DNA adenine methylase